MTERMRAVQAVRAVQRQWVADLRESVGAGGAFGVCNGDEFEELLIAMGIPTLAINYWNYLIIAQGKGARMTRFLNEAGYPGEHFFGFALAASRYPQEAPWGGLPDPTLICGSTRNEMETRVCELWAEQAGCPSITMDFSFPSPHFEPLPRDWWARMADDWERMVDPDRLNYRVMLEKQAIALVEKLTGQQFSIEALSENMARINAQMTLWREAQEMIASARKCPVHIRDQLSIYQAMWHRGTDLGIELIRAYRDEIAERVAAGFAAYPNERFRLYYSVQVPPWHDAVAERYGAVSVACSYTNIPDLYFRSFDPADPLRALAARHMFLFDWGPYRIIDVARRHRCDAVIAVEQAMENGPSRQQQVVEDAGIPYLAVPRGTDHPDIRRRIGDFIESRLEAKG